MNGLEEIYTQISVYVSIPYLLVFMFLSYTVKKYFGDLLQRVTKFEWRTVYTVLIIATLVAIPFLLCSEEGWIKIIVTYAVGTSLHEILFKIIENKLKK